MEFFVKSFSELDSLEMYQLLQVRSDVFVIEQQCIYRDMDDKDQTCHHLLGVEAGKVVAYSRLVPPGISYENASIGRVCTAKSVRMEGYGLILMEEAIKHCRLLWPTTGITISAQAYLEKFYMKFGFVTVSEPYMEDDIPHIKMILE